MQVVSPVGTGALDGNQTLGITVQVTDNGAPDSGGVTWTVAANKKGDPAGTLSNPQATTVTYNPPPGLTSEVQVAVTATSVTDPTRSASIPINVYPTPAMVTQSSDLATAFVNAAYTCFQTPLSVVNSVDQVPCQLAVTGGLAPFTWSLGNTQLPVGLQLAPGDPAEFPCSQLTGASCEAIVGQPATSGLYQLSIAGTDSLGSTATTNLTLTVAPSQLKVTTPTLLTLVTTPNAVPYAPVQLQASGGTPPYTWTLAPSSGGLPPGMTLSLKGVISGTPPQGYSGLAQFAAQVVDDTSPVPSQAIYPAPTIKQQGAANNIMNLGVPAATDSMCVAGGTSLQTNTPYAFLFTGFDADGPVTISGSFAADAQGNLRGEEDMIRNSGSQTAVPLSSGSSIMFNQVGRGCLTLNTAASSAQFRIAPTTLATSGSTPYFSDGRIVEYDDNTGNGTRGTGFFRIQNTSAFSTSSIAGPYAFRFSGWDAVGSHFAIAGTATANSGLITSAYADINDGGVLSGALSGGSGTIGSVDANGRGTATLSIGTGTYDLIFYIVDAGHLILNSPQAATSGHPLITGEAMTSAGPFSQATLSNSHIYRLAGIAAGSPDLEVGVLHFDGLGAVSGTAYERSGGTSTATTVSQQYTVDPTTGRFTFSGNTAIGYAVGEPSGVTGYLIGTSPAAGSGVLEFQTSSYPPGYPFGPISGNYGMAEDEILDAQTTAFAGAGNLSSAGSITIGSLDSFVDSSGPAGFPPCFQEFELFHYTWAADGSGTFGGNTYMVTNQAKFFYIDTSPQNPHPAVVVGQCYSSCPQ